MKRWSPFDQAAVLLLLIAVGIGLYARLFELGVRQLTVDEYYFVTSVRAILEHGVPALTGGGYYTRGLLQQYLTAGAVSIFGEGGFAYRLPSVLFNLGAIAAAYVYARRHLPRFLALLLPTFLLLSSWEVEFARFARMYAAFQFTTLLLLVAADRVLAGEQRAARWLPPLILLTLLTHQLAVLFLPVLALPAIAAWARGESLAGSPLQRAGYWGASVAVAGAAYLLAFADLRNLGVADRFPDGFEPTARSALRSVPLAVEELAVSAAVVVAAFLVYRIVRGGGARLSAPAAWSWAALFFAAIHSLLPAMVALAVVGGRYGVTPWSGEREARRVAGAAVAGLGVWIVVLATVPDSPSILRSLLAWPNIVDPVVRPWRNELPLLGSVIAAGLVGALVLSLREPLPTLLRHPAAPIAYILVLFGTLQSLYVSTRYTFFLYPVALLTLLVVAAKIGRSHVRIGGIAVALLFALSGDFDPAHLLEVSGREASWRTGRYEARGATWYSRHDFEAPADFVNAAVAANGSEARVLVVGLPAVSEYLDVRHAVFFGRTDPRFVNVSRARGTIDLWSGERLVSTVGELRDYLRGSDPLWVLVDSGHEMPAAVREAIPEMDRAEEAYVGRDGRIRVLRIPGPED